MPWRARTRLARQLAEREGDVLRGDIREPDAWAAAVRNVEGVIHAACTFTEDMGEVDRYLVEALIAEASKAARKIRFVYTGGAWLYGATGDWVATEETPLNDLFLPSRG